MAGIDKTYLKKWNQYKALYDWCKQVGEVIDDYGNKFSPISWLCEYTYEEWMKYTKHEVEEVYVWNTPLYLDIYLIRYCPLDFIQNRLKEQYGNGWSKTAFCHVHSTYDDILNKTSSYDNYVRNGVKNPKFKWRNPAPSLTNIRDFVWWVHIEDCEWSYDELANHWFHDADVYMSKGNWISNSATLKGRLTKRRLARILRKWNLPKGVTLQFVGDVYLKNDNRRYYMDGMCFDITIR
jgi:hypothetical protein